MMTEPQTIQIRPGVGILSVLSHLNYKPWFAIAEFVDNSIQSFLDYRAEIQKVDGRAAAWQAGVRAQPPPGVSAKLFPKARADDELLAIIPDAETGPRALVRRHYEHPWRTSTLALRAHPDYRGVEGEPQ